MLRYTDGQDYLEDHQQAESWTFRLGGPSQSTRTLLGVNSKGRNQRLAVGNFVWHRRTLMSKSGMREVEIRRGRVDELRECRESEYLALVDFGAELARVDARELVVEAASANGEWSVSAPKQMGPSDRRVTKWIDVAERAELPEPKGIDNLRFEKIEGRGSRKEVNAFLEGYEDGCVDHACGGVHHWKAAFVARYEGHIIAALVLAPPQNGVLAAEGDEIVISRIACHPARPQNTSSWMIARARDWAERSGYRRIAALAGVDGNRGTCYRAAGFDAVDGVSDYVDGKGNIWYKRRFVDRLNPDQYADRDVPLPGETAT